MYTSWSRKVKDWINIDAKSHRFESAMLDTFPHGVPIGGFGAGTIGISPTGNWNCFHLEPGKHCYMDDFTTGFSFELEIEGDAIPLSYENSIYSALYPMAKWDFLDKTDVDITFEQFTPVIMNEYQYTSYPVGCFWLKAKNNTAKAIVLKTFFELDDILDRQYQRLVDDENRMHFEFLKSENDFDTDLRDNGFIIYKENSNKKLESFGFFCDEDGVDLSRTDSSVRCILTKKIKAGEEIKIKFVVAWDFPEINFANGQILKRKYTEFFSSSNNRVENIANDVMLNFDQLYEDVNIWHIKVFEKMQTFSDDAKSMMINETYYLAHGGTLWEAGTDNFAYLECIDYPFYETLDVRFYSSWALLAGWPELEKKVMKLFAETISISDDTQIAFNTGFLAHLADTLESKGSSSQFEGPRKVRGACPHDLGSFEENPFKRCNSYSYQNPNSWKDLNPKFILMIYRDYYHTNDVQFLKDCYPAVKEAFEYFKIFDRDNDGLPENEGWPDQTYDNWTMDGTSAYCSLLWLSACLAYKEMSSLLDENVDGLAEYIVDGLKSLDKKLWNGEYYAFDQSHDDIMCDQLAGQWYLRFCGLPLLIDEEREKLILQKIYQKNFVEFADMKYGMVNGRTREGNDVFNPQGNDVWTGVNYGISAYLNKVGLLDESESLLNSLHKSLYGGGFAFRSPESIDGDGKFIAQLYMRPQAAWAMFFV